MTKNINRIRDLTGQKFGRLTVIGLDNSKESRHTFWICQCECGNVISTRSDRLTRDGVKSCGCYKREQDTIRVAKNHKHKQSGTRLYSIWQGIKGRCYNPHDPCYFRWGGRGIKVCEEWLAGFEPFYKWAVESGYQDNLTIDRIDNDGDYCPENCRWATQKEQSRNRSSNIKITIGNSTRTMTEWCEIFQLSYRAICARYHRTGFVSIDDLFNRPTIEGRYRGKQQTTATVERRE